MQRKPTTPTEPSFADMHFAVAPYEVQFSVPNDQIYSLYFEKGLQILGQTQYPIENHEKLKKIDLPIQQNVIPFRLLSDKNAEYQWSIYKRVSEMEEFLETKKINLKETMKKQPQKRVEPVRVPLQKKQTNSKSDVRRSDTRANTIRPKQNENGEFTSMIEKNLAQRFVDPVSEARGLVYSESIVCDVGKFTLRFYLFKASSNNELNKTIEDKAREKQQTSKNESHGHSGFKPVESERVKEQEGNRNALQAAEEIPVEETMLPNESENKFISSEVRENGADLPVETVQEPVQEQKSPEKVQQSKYPLIQDTPEPFSDNPHPQEQAQNTQAFAAEPAPVQTPTQYPPVQQQPQTDSGLKRTDSVIIQDPNTKKETQKQQKVQKKRSHLPNIFITIVVIALCLFSYLNVFDMAGQITSGLTGMFDSPAGAPKKGKKERFSNRKKVAN